MFWLSLHSYFWLAHTLSITTSKSRNYIFLSVSFHDSCSKAIPDVWQVMYCWNIPRFFTPCKNSPLVCKSSSLYKRASTNAFLDTGPILEKEKTKPLGSETVLDSGQWDLYPDVQLKLLDPVFLAWLGMAAWMLLRVDNCRMRNAREIIQILMIWNYYESLWTGSFRSSFKSLFDYVFD